MTTEQIHRIITVNGLVKGNGLHRMKIDGRTVGLDELRYNEGRKYLSQRVKLIYQGVINGTL